jgi:hypothetical protein
LQRNWFFSVNPAAGVPEPIPASLFTGTECQYPAKRSIQAISPGFSSCYAEMFAQDETFLQGAVEAVKELAQIATSGLSVWIPLASSMYNT